MHMTTRNAPYVHQRLDSILELCRTFRLLNTGERQITTSVFDLMNIMGGSRIFRQGGHDDVI